MYIKLVSVIVAFTAGFGLMLAGCTLFSGVSDLSEADNSESNISTDTTGGNDTMKEAYSDYFTIGVALPSAVLSGYGDLVSSEFGSITAENEMKPESLQAYRGLFTFKAADKYIEFAQSNNLKVRGHTLVWHNQTPAWMFAGENGTATREELLAAMESHIKNVVGHFKGKVYCWDVVNEAVSDNQGEYLRNSKYMQIIGEDFIKYAFIYAHEADPDALLFYNDYSTENPAKREKIVRMIRKLQDEGVPIDGIGLQCHYNIYQTPVDELQRSIDIFSGMGLDVHITELDMSIYSYGESNLKFDELPSDRAELQTEIYNEIFSVLRDNKDKVTSVTFWGLSDKTSWLNNFPVRDRNDWPLLYDKEMTPKAAYYSIKDFD